jgi:hypothetical protein
MNICSYVSFIIIIQFDFCQESLRAGKSAKIKKCFIHSEFLDKTSLEEKSVNRETKQKNPTTLIIVLIVFFAIFMVYYNFYYDEPLIELSFPKTMLGVKLDQIITGPQAVNSISKLHGLDISIKKGYVASYSGSRQQIMIWASQSNSIKEAQQLFEIMDAKIIKSAQTEFPPFSKRRELEKQGLKIIAVKGMGMENYYYQKGAKVYWIAVGGVDPLLVLNEAIRKLP